MLTRWRNAKMPGANQLMLDWVCRAGDGKKRSKKSHICEWASGDGKVCERENGKIQRNMDRRSSTESVVNTRGVILVALKRSVSCVFVFSCF